MSRTAALRGQDIALTAHFLGADGEPIVPGPDLKLSIYPPGVDPRSTPNAEPWIRDITLSSPGEAGAGYDIALTRTLEPVVGATGKYTYLFAIPDDCDLGTAFDRWQATVDLEELDEAFTFVVVGGGSIGTTRLYENNMVIVRLRGEIAALDETTLGSDYLWYFTTTYNPLYASARRVQLDMGSIASEIPEDTMNQAIFEASLEASAYQIITNVASSKEVSMFSFARRQYVVCRAQMILLDALINKGISVSDQMSKKLADLQVTRGGGTSNIATSMEKLDKCMEKWLAILETGGILGPGTSLKPSIAVKGTFDPDRPMIGRDWGTTNTTDPNGAMPAANAKFRISGTRRWKGGFRGSRWDSSFDD